MIDLKPIINSVSHYRSKLLQISFHFIFIAIFLTVWQIVGNSSENINFFVGTPYLVVKAFTNDPIKWLMDMTITGLEAFGGFLLGVLVGSLIGFALLYSKKLASFTKPYIIAFGAIPIFGIAPLLIVWFGTGYSMKVASAFFATVFVALLQSYEGGKNVDKGLINWFTMYSNSRKDLFFKLILPSSMNWVFASLKLNIGLALLGAFIGEFISANSGLGYEILSAGGIYDFPRVFAATLLIIFLSIFLNALVGLVEEYRFEIIKMASVPKIVKNFEKEKTAK